MMAPSLCPHRIGRSMPSAAIAARVSSAARPRLASKVVRRFGDDGRHAIGHGEREAQGDDRAVAVSPQRRTLETEGVDDRAGLVSRAAMKVGRQRVDRRRPPVSGSIRNDEAVLRRQRGDLPIEGIHVVAPAAVQDHDRRSAPRLPIMDTRRRDAGRERRLRDVEKTHATPMLR